jgi:hypothetical protein
MGIPTAEQGVYDRYNFISASGQMTGTPPHSTAALYKEFHNYARRLVIRVHNCSVPTFLSYDEGWVSDPTAASAADAETCMKVLLTVYGNIHLTPQLGGHASDDGRYKEVEGFVGMPLCSFLF